MADSDSSNWIFGYGSLVWRADFPYAERCPAWIRGYSRRFWQGSTDHRGVPGAPGRVVTLIRDPESTCFGMAYRLRADDLETVLDHLDHRERGGYDRERVPLHFEARQRPSATAWLYRATPANRNYLGPADLEAIAAQVRDACGPSGPNLEYVVELDRFLQQHSAEDQHVAQLARLLAR